MQDDATKSRFAMRLKKLREDRKMSQAALAKRMNLSQSTIASWETCNREPTLQTLEETADVFGVTIDYLFARTDNPMVVHKSDTPYIEVTPFEKTILETYRSLSEIEQTVVCRSLGLIHPAEQRVRASRA